VNDDVFKAAIIGFTASFISGCGFRRLAACHVAPLEKQLKSQNIPHSLEQVAELRREE